MASDPVIVWFRHDLRLADNPALSAAAQSGAPILCVYIFDETVPAAQQPGGASRWWLHHSLAALDDSLQRLGQRLVLYVGDPGQILPELCETYGVGSVFWNRDYDGHAVARDAALKARLKDAGRKAESFNGFLLYEPWEVGNKDGEPYKVFSPFWKAAQKSGIPPQPIAAPAKLAPPPADLEAGTALSAFGLLPTKPDWASGLRETWTPGEEGASQRFDAFLDEALGGYAAERDFPGKPSTSRMSPYLHFGETSPRLLFYRVLLWREDGRGPQKAADKFLAELGWREFSWSLLHYNPHLPNTELREDFRGFPWGDDAELLGAWRRGRTGYPIVDAGMRELWHTGWMHNRVRMIVGSFLVKHLLQDWRQGEAWFWDTLVDADLGNNAASWQWIAGCGADAAPYFRIFNPMLQSQKFDPEGTYVRRWVPELSALPTSVLHEPWTAPELVLKEAGVDLGETYPRPIVDHAQARARALEAFETIKKSG